MGAGIGIVLDVARSISALPNAILLTGTLSDGFILSVTAAGLLLCIGRGVMRWLSAPIAMSALVFAMTAPKPDLFVTHDGGVALWRENGQMHVLGPESRRYRFERTALLRASGLGSAHKGTDRRDCDFTGCRLSRHGRIVSILWYEGGLIEDCWDADILIATFPIRRACPGPAHVVDRFDLHRTGGITVSILTEGRIEVSTVSAFLGRRPWTVSGAAGSGDRSVLAD